MIRIYGSSDDLIEIDGDITKEFSDVDFLDKVNYVLLSTGTVIAVYTNHVGNWNATAGRVAEGDTVQIVRIRGGKGDMGLEVRGRTVDWVAIADEENIAFRKESA